MFKLPPGANSETTPLDILLLLHLESQYICCNLSNDATGRHERSVPFVRCFLCLTLFQVFGLDLALNPYPFYALSLATNILVTALTGTTLR